MSKLDQVYLQSDTRKKEVGSAEKGIHSNTQQQLSWEEKPEISVQQLQPGTWNSLIQELE